MSETACVPVVVATLPDGRKGATLEWRLSERPGVDVVLLEAGAAQRSAEVDAAMRSPNPGRVLRPESPFVWRGAGSASDGSRSALSVGAGSAASVAS